MWGRKLMRLAALLTAVLNATSAGTFGEDLFNGVDLSGWTYHAQPWTVLGGTMRNTGPGNDPDWIGYDTVLSGGQFDLAVRVKVVDHTGAYPRFRTNLASGLYFGNEGFIRQFEIYGPHLSNVAQMRDDSYAVGSWYTLRFKVDNRDNVSFYKDNQLTHIARRNTREDIRLQIRPGDNWSGGHIQVASVEYVAGPRLPAEISPRVINPANGHEYVLLDAATWEESQAKAVQLGGHLVTINDQAEQDWVYALFGFYAGVSRVLWTGLNDAAAEGTFVWSSAEPVGYSNWYPGDPNNFNGMEHYVALYNPGHFAEGTWADWAAVTHGVYGNPINGVVEIPEPAAFSLLTLAGLALMRRRHANKDRRIVSS